jgi:hypothetical protein
MLVLTEKPLLQELLYRTGETEGSQPAMKSRRNERVDLSCK